MELEIRLLLLRGASGLGLVIEPFAAFTQKAPLLAGRFAYPVSTTEFIHVNSGLNGL